MKYIVASKTNFRGFSTREAAITFFLKIIEKGYKMFPCNPGRICNAASQDGNIIWMQKIA